MADLVTNVVEIKGEEEAILDLIKRTKLVEDTTLEENEFDFNGIIEMPKELLDTVSPPQIFQTQTEADDYNQKRINDYTKNKHSLHERTGAITEAEKERRAEVYGYTKNTGIFRPRPVISWSEWANTYWGTKWNGFAVKFIKHEKGLLVVQFDTAWCRPEPLYEVLEAEGFEVNDVSYGELGGRVDYYGRGEEIFEVRTTHEVEYVG